MTETMNRLHAAAAAAKLGESYVGRWRRDWAMLIGHEIIYANAQSMATPELVALARKLGVWVNWNASAPAGAYDVEKDHILIPWNMGAATAEPLARVLAHEIGHATGHPSRMNRTALSGANSGYMVPYTLEEITAETFSFLATDQLGLSSPTQTAQYFANYRPNLDGDDAAYEAAIQAGVDAYTRYGT